MPTEPIRNFPSLTEIEDHITKQSLKPSGKTPWTRYVIGALIVLILGLVLKIALPQKQAVVKAGSGRVSGTVVNHLSTPVPAVVFLLNSKLATVSRADDGAFTLANIPSGPQKVIVGYNGMGREFLVNVETGKTIAMGQILVETTQVPSGQ
jgi:hypothetical protein